MARGRSPQRTQCAVEINGSREGAGGFVVTQARRAKSVSEPGARRQPIRAFCARGPALLAPCEPSVREHSSGDGGAALQQPQSRRCSPGSIPGWGAVPGSRGASAWGCQRTPAALALKTFEAEREARQLLAQRRNRLGRGCVSAPRLLRQARTAALGRRRGEAHPAPVLHLARLSTRRPPTRVTSEAVRPPTGQHSTAAEGSLCHTTTSRQRALRRGRSSPAVPAPSSATIRS
jgi:hypothetical protein